MSKYFVVSSVCVIFIFGYISTANSEDCNAKGQRLLSRYLEYREDISSGKETIKYYNIHYLYGEMDKNGVPEKERSSRLARYTFALEDIQLSAAGILSGYIGCGEGYSHLVVKVFGRNIGEIFYMSIRLIDEKIINISKERKIPSYDGLQIIVNK